jgi:hypothetical protein
MRILASLLLALLPTVASASALVVDSGDDPLAWTALASPNVKASIERRDGAFGLKFDLGRARGHALARRDLSVDLPADYMFVFVLEADCEPNTLEIKFVSGHNVWWRRLPDYDFPRDAKDVHVSKPRIAFAWGPDGGKGLRHLDAIEIAVVAGKGGKGTVWIDEIRLEPRDGDAVSRPPTATVSSNADAAANLLDGDPATVWRSSDAAPTVTLDFHDALEHGGLAIEHVAGGFAKAYAVDASVDGKRWMEVRRFTKGDGGTDWIYLPDAFARFLRLRFSPPAGQQVAIADIRVQPYEFSESENGFFTGIARAAAPGLYPRYFGGPQSYWTVVGAPGDSREALINEEGSVEVDAGAFTIEPFLWRGGKLVSWWGTANSVSLDGGDLPIPTVTREGEGLRLTVTAVAAGEGERSTLLLRYRVELVSGGAERVRLFAAIRPFQVLPPWQALNRVGGTTRVRRIARDGDRRVDVDGYRVLAHRRPDAFGAAAFEQGDVTNFLLRGEVPPSLSADDPFAHASAAMAWDLDLEPGRAVEVWVEVPHGRAWKGSPDEALEKTRAEWRSVVDRVGIELPEAARDWASSLRSNLAYVLVNMDGPAIQPGSRTYERSWIRDGAMTSAALLELGLDEPVKTYLRWYAGYVGKDGWVPCCVDRLGADPTPEHDSFGEFVWAVGEVWRFTRDRDFVLEMWPHVKAVAGCMSRLRATRMTAPFLEEGRRAYFGLLPESISHEGYSAKPVHSYWDQAFALRGYMDAAMLAGVVGDEEAAASLALERDAFEHDLRESVRRTMAAHRMDLVPASVELGDFDPTSTAVSFLLGTEGVYPTDALQRSFAKYMQDFRARTGRTTPGVGYTAYELRSATALVLLGKKEEAIEMLDALTADQRPAAWNQWPEITWLDPGWGAFLGDLPHTWIGSSYVHAVRTLLVAEREDPESLLVGAGIPLRWLDGGGRVRGRALPTWFGHLSVAMRREDEGGRVRVAIDLAAAGPAGFAIPSGGLRVAAPFGAEVATATVDGVAALVDGDTIVVPRLPAAVVFDYKPQPETRR